MHDERPGNIPSQDPKHSNLFLVVQTCKLEDRRCVCKTIPRDILHSITRVFENIKRKRRNIRFFVKNSIRLIYLQTKQLSATGNKLSNVIPYRFFCINPKP